MLSEPDKVIRRYSGHLINKCSFHLLKYGQSTDWTSSVKFTIVHIIITIEPSGEDGTAGAGKIKGPSVMSNIEMDTSI